MSTAHEPEMTDENLAPPPASAEDSSEPVTPAPAATPAVARFRKEFYTDSQYGLMMSMGEEPEGYQRILEPMLVDLDPSEGLEFQVVEQMAQALWRLRRTQHMLDGLGVKRLKQKFEGEQMSAAVRGSQAFTALEPFVELRDALAPRVDGPTAAEIDAFIERRGHDSSPQTQEFILLLRSLKEPMEARKRKALRGKARIDLQRLMEGFATLASQCAQVSEHVRSQENMAALMAPNDVRGVQLHRMEDACLRRFMQLTSALAKVRKGALDKKSKKSDERSRNVYENKQNMDTLPDEKSDISCVKIQNMESGTD